MPRFMDFHEDLKLPQEAINEIAQGTRDGATDEFGVRQIELYYNADGRSIAFWRAPMRRRSASITRRLDVPCGDVHRVDSLS